MKKYFKLLFVIITSFVFTLGFSVNAEVEGEGFLNIYYPIHKTDEAGKPLTGVQFTYSNASGDYTLTSEELEDGDYLISYANQINVSRRDDIDLREPEEKNQWDNLIKFIPSKYREGLENINSWDDVVEFFNSLYDDGYPGEIESEDYAYATMFVPVYIEETVAPEGYDKVKLVAFASLYIEISFNGYGYAYLESGTAYYGDNEDLIGYIKYDSSKDYETIFKDISVEYYDECYDSGDNTTCTKLLAKLLKDNGFSSDVADCSRAKEYYDDRPGPVNDEMLARFDEDTLNYTCILQVKDHKTIVNPETYGTLIVVLILVIGSIGLFVFRKTRTNE